MYQITANGINDGEQREREGEDSGRVRGIFPVMHRDVEGKNKHVMKENSGDSIRGSAPEVLPGEEVGQTLLWPGHMPTVQRNAGGGNRASTNLG